MSTATEIPYVEERSAWRLMWLLVIGVVLSLVDRQVLAIVVEPLKHDLGLSDTQIGILQGPAITLFFALAAVPFGWVVDRHNRRNLMLVCLLIWSVATAACGFVKSFEQLLVLRIVVAIGEASWAPALFSIVADLFRPERRRSAYAMQMATGFIGGALALTLGGVAFQAVASSGLKLFGLDAPWRVAFVVVAAPGIPLAAAMLLFREPARHAALASAASPVATPLPMGKLALLALATGFTSAGITALSAWGAPLLVRAHGFEPGAAGVQLGAMAVLTCTLAGFAAALLPRRISGSERVLGLDVASVTAVFAALAGLLLFAPLPPLGVAAALAGTLGLFLVPYGLLPVVVQAWTPGAVHGRVFATIKFVEVLIAGGGAVIVGALSDRSAGAGLSTALAGTIGVCGLLAAGFFVLAWRKARA